MGDSKESIVDVEGMSAGTSFHNGSPASEASVNEQTRKRNLESSNVRRKSARIEGKQDNNTSVRSDEDKGEERNTNSLLSRFSMPQILTLISYFPPVEVHKMRLSCKVIKNAIDHQPKTAYRMRRLILSVFMQEDTVRLLVEKSAYGSFSIFFTDWVCSKPYSYNHQQPKNVIQEKFTGINFDSAIDELLVRAGGIDEVGMSGTLTDDHFIRIISILKQSTDVCIMCSLDQVSSENLFDVLSSVRKLTISHPIQIDDRFCREAAEKELIVYDPVQLSNDQLMILVERRDLELLKCSRISGPNLETIRSAVQVLLCSKLRCTMKIDVEDMTKLKEILTRKLDNETIEQKGFKFFFDRVGGKNKHTVIVTTHYEQCAKAVLSIYAHSY